MTIKDKKLKYIQACYGLTEEAIRKRKFGTYKWIDDNYSKYVISKNQEDCF